MLSKIIILNILIISFLLFIHSCSKSINDPTIILINIDDMGWRDVGFTGSEYYETPNIDNLAAAGMVFT